MGLISQLKSFFTSDGELQSSTDALPFADTKSLLLWPEKNKDLYAQLEDTYYQYFIGVNSLLNLELNSFEIDVIRILTQTLKSNQSLAAEIPRLPDVVPKLIHILRSNDFDWKEVADLIATDPVILVGIIKVANLEKYKLNVKNEKLEDVLIKIGLTEVRKLIMKVALKPIMLFEGGHFLRHSGTKIWVHAVKSAVACRTLAHHYQQDPFDAYLSGLLSNLGMTIVVQKMNEIKEFQNAPRSYQFRDKLLNISRQLSVKIAENWEINGSVYQALLDQIDVDSTKMSPLGSILYEANAVSMMHILKGENRWFEYNHEIQSKEIQPFMLAYQEVEALNLG